ncbi:hypothetical protein SAMN05421820_107214 [Pedobacter steynii]|uniref:Lipoprotein n=1 Tax=Pedobacter steynii TaxID=430522 RepID=A0A1H0AV97_9SPHI|nr:hypothetical protein [Pedobacter steynii]NQX41250.1 hypothetical protein [Pedobacter steynii]SDN37372.1 hypothetical protein SAMN05421820_107214 [Pedobacter steynii]
MKQIYYFTFAIILLGVVIAVGCRKQDTAVDAERGSDLKASARAELFELNPRLKNVPDFSNDKDMVEFTKLMNETREFSRTNVYKSFREKTILKKVTIPKNATKSDLKKAYLEAGRGDEFEKLSATFDKQASLITSFMKSHPELRKLNKDELSMIFLKVFELNRISAPKGSVSIYRKVQELEADKCRASFTATEQANQSAYSNYLAGATASYVVAETACLAAGPGYPVCWAAATATYGIALAVIESNNTDAINTNLVQYNICMSGLSRGVSGEYKKRTMITFSL